MSILTVSQLTKSFPPDDIFAGVSFSLPYRARYAIVGPNGVGKTTLLRIIAGREEASAGAYQIARGCSIGYLPQEAAFGSQHTLWEECLRAFSDIREQETELKRLEVTISSPDSDAELELAMERYGVLQSRFENRGGYDYEVQIRRVLTGLGFAEKDFAYRLDHLSGGQRTRALLARLLLSGHDLLLLDEPTNHLDIAAVEWLESFLREWDGAALIVSHDRYFLDRVATHILEMFRGSMETYRGNYSAYVNQRGERWALRRSFFDLEKARLEKDMAYIKKNIAGQNVSQAKGKLARLSRYLEAVEQIGFEGVKGRKWSQIAAEVSTGYPMGVAEAEERIKSLRPPISNRQKLKLRLSPKRRSGNIILRSRKLEIGYPGNLLFETEDIEFHRQECAAIIGPNGAGKSSFLKTILGEIAPTSGRVELGASLDTAYFVQAHEDLDTSKSIINEIDTIAPHMLPGEIRKYLAQFLFTADDVFKPVSVLSGGERGRLALAKLALSDANLLLLDEPTNHLDIPAQEILQDVLSSFGGTIILVSHDRYLIEALGSQIWHIDPEKKKLSVFRGGYAEYNAQNSQIGLEKSEPAPDGREKIDYVEGKKEKNKALRKKRQKKKRLEEVETLISILEEKQAALSKELEHPPNDSGKVQKLGEEYDRTENRLSDLIQEWEKLHK